MQDKALQVIAAAPNAFYLTGGTVVGRHLLHHRYSDDLDFFVNRSGSFIEDALAIGEALQSHFELVETNVAGDDFYRYYVSQDSVQLKIELINDVGYRAGHPEKTPLFVRTDNWQNILSNKITALNRDAPKDVADIIFLARRFSFHWKDVFHHAAQKSMDVSELNASRHLYEFPEEKMREVNWINEVDYHQLKSDLQQIGRDIFESGNNSLAPQ